MLCISGGRLDGTNYVALNETDDADDVECESERKFGLLMIFM